MICWRIYSTIIRVFLEKAHLNNTYPRIKTERLENVRAQNNGGLKRLYGADTASCYAHHETGRDISQIIIDSITCMRYVEYREGFPL